MTWFRHIVIVAALAFAWPAAAQTPQTGTFIVSDTPIALIEDRAQAWAPTTRVDAKISWVVHVPPAYDPARPPGIVVYISSTSSGDVPKDWDGVLDRDNLIWISARDAGNDEETRRRIYDAILALALVQKRYAYDPQRLYVAGFSGGGRTASTLMATAPYLFNGALYICGVDVIKAETPDLAARMISNRYVFMTGGGDFNHAEVKAAYKAYLKAGAMNSHLMDLKRLEHVLPAADDFAAALDLLDAGVAATANPVP